MESLVKILGAFVDTLVLNVYPVDTQLQVEERRVDPLLQEELKLLKEQAQEIEEDVPSNTRLFKHGMVSLAENDESSKKQGS
jgi:hypothetical protein